MAGTPTDKLGWMLTLACRTRKPPRIRGGTVIRPDPPTTARLREWGCDGLSIAPGDRKHSMQVIVTLDPDAAGEDQAEYAQELARRVVAEAQTVGLLPNDLKIRGQGEAIWHGNQTQ